MDSKTRCAGPQCQSQATYLKALNETQSRIYIRFLHIANGSAAELRTQLYISGEIGLLDKETVNELVAELKHISAMLQKAASTLKQRLTT
jgi:four helix bundle protein